MKNKEYALYKGENIIATGTIKEIAEKTGVREQTITYYGTQSYRNKIGRRNISKKNSRILVSIEEEDMKICTSCNEKIPRTPEFFLVNTGFNGGFNDGFLSVCITCRSKNKNRIKSKREFIEESALMFEVGKRYEIKALERGKIVKHFEGEVIQITKNHITLRNTKHGYCESFKEIDFKNRDYSIQEVI